MFGVGLLWLGLGGFKFGGSAMAVFWGAEVQEHLSLPHTEK